MVRAQSKSLIDSKRASAVLASSDEKQCERREVVSAQAKGGERRQQRRTFEQLRENGIPAATDIYRLTVAHSLQGYS